MSEIKFEYEIRSDLLVHPESPASLGPKFLDTLDTLSRIDPGIFTNWTIPVIPDLEWLMDEVERSGIAAAIEKTETYSLEAARPRIAAIVDKNVSRDDLREPDPTYGYSLVADAGPADKSRHMKLWIKAGGRVSGSASLKTGDYKVLPDPALVTYPLFKAALLAINAIWPASYAYASANRIGYDTAPLFPGAELFPSSGFHIPWLGYLSGPLASGLELPPEILTERTPDGGLLMSATEDRLDPTVPEHWRRARMIAEIMIARNPYSKPKQPMGGPNASPS